MWREREDVYVCAHVARRYDANPVFPIEKPRASVRIHQLSKTANFRPSNGKGFFFTFSAFSSKVLKGVCYMSLHPLSRLWKHLPTRLSSGQ